MAECHIYSAIHDRVCYIRLVGRVNFTSCSRFDAFIRNVFLQGSFEDVVIDLCRTEHIDSTIFGLLARIARYTLIRYGHKPRMYSTRSDINILLGTMSFQTAFDIFNEETTPPGGLQEIPHLEDEDSRPGHIVLDAHRTLMRMSKRNADAFRPVVEQLEVETQNSSASNSDAENGSNGEPPS